METDNLYDGFVITHGNCGFRPHDKVIITPPGNVIDTEKEAIFELADDDYTYSYGYEIMDKFANDNCLPLTTEDYVLLDKDDFFVAMTSDEGEVFYADENITIISVGIVDINDILDNSYGLTAKGENYLIEEDIFPDITGIEREETNMDTMFGTGFGKCHDSRFALSVNGIAVRQNGTGKYVVYNKDNNEFVDTTNMLLNIKDALFTLPASQVNIGDTIIHENKPYYIVGIKDGIKAVSYEDCVETTLIPKTTMFGVKYFTKVFSLFGDNFAADGELFSNPIMLMSLMGENNDMTKLLAYSSIAKGDLASNPMLMAFLMKGEDKGDFSTLAMLSMLNGKNPFGVKTNQE